LKKQKRSHNAEVEVMDTNKQAIEEESAIPLTERPDWALIKRTEVLSMVGVCESALFLMIKKGMFPDGIRVLGRTKLWRVGQAKEMAARLHSGEFSGVRLWGKDS
jgi:predicted DNA-binding transcriptional regulator AlpA